MEMQTEPNLVSRQKSQLDELLQDCAFDLLEPAEQFRTLAELYCAELKAQGVRAVPYNDRGLVYFRSLSDDRQRSIVETLKVNCSVLEYSLRGLSSTGSIESSQPELTIH